MRTNESEYSSSFWAWGGEVRGNIIDTAGIDTAGAEPWPFCKDLIRPAKYTKSRKG